MGNEISLKSIFSLKKDDLANQLGALTLPHDVQKVQKTVTDFLNLLFENEGEYRQNLSKPEDYIFQAAMNLLNAQEKLNYELSEIVVTNTENSVNTNELEAHTNKLKKNQYPFVVGGAALGSAVGSLIGSWGAILGSITMTAIAIYYTKQKENKSYLTTKSKLSSSIQEQELDVDLFIGIIENICQSVDTLIATFKAQVNRVVDKYELTQKPTLEGDYVELLENIQALLGAYAMDSASDNRAKRIDQRIQFLEESLENYSIQSVVYDGNNNEMFNFQPSANVAENTMVLPALVKDGKVVIKGKIFTKQ